MSFDKSAGWDTAPLPPAVAGAPKRYIAEAISASSTQDGVEALQATLEVLTAAVVDNSARTEIYDCAKQLEAMCERLKASNVEKTLEHIETALVAINVTLGCIQSALPAPQSAEDHGPGGRGGPAKGPARK